jgi:hypothetical protein
VDGVARIGADVEQFAVQQTEEAGDVAVAVADDREAVRREVPTTAQEPQRNRVGRAGGQWTV